MSIQKFFKKSILIFKKDILKMTQNLYAYVITFLNYKKFIFKLGIKNLFTNQQIFFFFIKKVF